MLFKQRHLIGIKSGDIKLAFRKWSKPSVKSGSLIHTSVGLIKIDNIEKVHEWEISENDAIQAGYLDREKLINSIPNKSDATLYKIKLSYYGPDPRIKLREKKILSSTEYEELKKKIQKLDTCSRQGNWTIEVLLAISGNPHHHAVGIAKLTNFEKEWLKRNIRKLKNLGLTTSQKTGYELSPLGKHFLNRLLSEDWGREEL